MILLDTYSFFFNVMFNVPRQFEVIWEAGYHGLGIINPDMIWGQMGSVIKQVFGLFLQIYRNHLL